MQCIIADGATAWGGDGQPEGPAGALQGGAKGDAGRVFPVLFCSGWMVLRGQVAQAGHLLSSGGASAVLVWCGVHVVWCAMWCDMERTGVALMVQSVPSPRPV